MPKAVPRNASRSDARRRAIALDPDRLGLAVGGLASCAVLVVTLWFRHVGPLESVVRAGVVFVVSYAVTFVLAVIIKRITLTEIAKQREAERERIMNLYKKEGETRQGGSE